MSQIYEVLFPKDEVEEFEVSELFMEPSISLNVAESPASAALSLTPRQLLLEIRQLAEKRYSYSLLPKKQHQLKALDGVLNKISLLRDVCFATGVVLNVKQGTEALCLLLDNDSQAVKRTLSEQVRKTQGQQAKGKKGKNNQSDEALADAELFKYEHLPFKPQMVGEFFPVTKRIHHQNKDSTIFSSQARQFLNEGELMGAFDFYNQAVSVMTQVAGPMNMEVATSIQKMSNVQYKLSDYLTAIELLSKSIVIQEKVLGCDHAKVAYCYSNLGLYYHSAKFYRKGFEMMQRSLQVLEQVAGSAHPDVLHIYMNLGLMYSDAGRYRDSVQSFNVCLKRYLVLYGESHIQVVSCYQAIAHTFYLQGDFRKALEY